jgi:hypothetical protein
MSVEEVFNQIGPMAPLDCDTFASFDDRNGKFRAVDNCCTLFYTANITIIYSHLNNDTYKICKYGCDFKYLFITICPDNENSSFGANIFPGLFDQKYMVVEAIVDE